jgi:hypothetical protein
MVYTTWAAAARNQERAIRAQPRLAASRRLAARAHMSVVNTRATKMPAFPKAWDVAEVRPSKARYPLTPKMTRADISAARTKGPDEVETGRGSRI